MKKIFVLLGLIFFSKFLHSQTYTVPGAQIQPGWVFPLWLTNGDGQRDTLYFCYDAESQSNGYSADIDSLMGEKLIKVDHTKFNGTFEAVGMNDSILNKVDVNYDLSFAEIYIFFENVVLPLLLEWDANVFYSDSLQYPSLYPAPNAEGRLWFDFPTIVDGCSFGAPIIMTDSVVSPTFTCYLSDSILFNGDGLSPFLFSVHAWKGTYVGFNQTQSITQFNVYPSVAANELFISVQDISPLTVFSLYNICGNMVCSTKLNTALTNINVSNLSNGFYYYTISVNSKSQISDKLIIQH